VLLKLGAHSVCSLENMSPLDIVSVQALCVQLGFRFGSNASTVKFLEVVSTNRFVEISNKNIFN